MARILPETKDFHPTALTPSLVCVDASLRILKLPVHVVTWIFFSSAPSVSWLLQVSSLELWSRLRGPSGLRGREQLWRTSRGRKQFVAF